MAALPPFARVRREDIEGAPDWIDSVLSRYNNALEAVYLAFNKGIDFEKNIRCSIERIQCRTTDFPYTVAWKFDTAPRGVVVLYAAINQGTTPATDGAYFPVWTYTDGQIKISSISNLVAGNRYDVTLLIL